MKKKPSKSKTPPWRNRLARGLRWFAMVIIVLYALVWWNVLRIVEHDHWPPPEDAVTAAQSQQMAEEFLQGDDVRRDDAAIAYAPSTASDVRFYLDGSQFFPEMVRDIESAEHSVHIIMFGFTPGGWGDTFADLLIAQVAGGIEVRLVVDGQGSKATGDNEEFFLRLADGGVQIVVNDTLTIQATGELPDRDRNLRLDEVGHADHRKMLVIDGRVGWVGGAGFEDHYYDGGWLDTYVRVEGDVVLQLQAVFCTSFHAYAGELPGDLNPYFPEPADSGDISITVLQNFPGGFVPATQASHAVLERETGQLDIMNAYFTDAGMLDRIIDAAGRGVDVRILASKDSNVYPAQYALVSQYSRLMDAGVEIWEIPGVLHAKVTVAGDAVIIGSLNYDAWALYRNLELALLIEDESAADAAREVLIEPTVDMGTQPDPPDGWRETIPARIWWWLRYYL